MSEYKHTIILMTSGSIAYPEQNDHIYTDLHFFISTMDLSSNTKAVSDGMIIPLPLPDFSNYIKYKDVDKDLKLAWIEKQSPGLLESMKLSNIQKLQNGNF